MERTTPGGLHPLLSVVAVIGLVGGGLFVLPYALGFGYAWSALPVYWTVCKDGSFKSDISADEYRIFLLNRGCDPEAAARQIAEEVLKDPQAADRAVRVYRGETPAVTAEDRFVDSMADGSLIQGIIHFRLHRFRPFDTYDPNCPPESNCPKPSFFSDDLIGNLMSNYVDYLDGPMHDSIAEGSRQVAQIWRQGPLTRGILLVVYAALAGIAVNAIYSLIFKSA
ncbi:hypothetical protein [Hyphomicrobium sp.]|uniref:hypothetical protein n=1 Tax=Hyphomicrobium sp. TaxID=82 RepID=UPI0025B801F1|nr:hypothetical protein [Hyphomicrobium sp.]MCC7250523.1 hypothetical protein [Hyphomicrobium sp.]